MPRPRKYQKKAYKPRKRSGATKRPKTQKKARKVFSQAQIDEYIGRVTSGRKEEE